MNACDKFLSGFYGKLAYEDYSVLDRSARTLLSNILEPAPGKTLPWSPWRGISPSQLGFRGIWNWDCAFHAVGVSNWDAALGREQIRLFLSLQKPSGLLPDVVSENGKVVDNFGKPPVMPWAAMRVDMKEPDDEFLSEIYPKFVLYEEHWRKNRGGDARGLFNYDAVHESPAERLKHAKFESGWDNAVRWDGGIIELWPVDLNCFMAMLYQAMAYMARRLKKEADEKRWLAAEKSQKELIESRLWSEKDQAYLDFNYVKGEFVDALSPASFMPLYIGSASPERAAAMAKLAADESKFFPLWPTVAYDHKQFDPTGYWRGRTWLNVAYFALKGLKDCGFDKIADAGKKAMLDLVRNAPDQIYENYHPKTGAPVGVRQFSWSAVFAMEFLLNWERSPR